ncbi:hypothetical protein L596_012337 [Steinernema carpocapsae]|uniref:Trehalase n=1 Tax=Steinernema carpocapsae TaxID=34508 RepID=A0A4U5NX03_STECR|nr:hypothetical protein L596_012337 [Steinernema carpocapsae]
MSAVHLVAASLLFSTGALWTTRVGATDIHVCDETNSPNWYIYCSGPILESVNYHALFNDSKHYVDMPTKNSPNDTIKAWYDTFGQTAPPDVPEDKLRNFIEEYFSDPGSELVNCTPVDWIEKPPKIMSITDPTLRAWALELHGIWKHLCKQFWANIVSKSSEENNSSECQSDQKSLSTPTAILSMASGRFREFYYWDAYWIVKGLLVSGMYNSTRGMIINLASMVDKFGFVPNGGRVYYLQRSQPPMLIPMVYEYYEATNDREFVRHILPTLVKELNFWHTNRTTELQIGNKNYTVFQYRTNSNVPRPESFKEDVRTAHGISDDLKPKFWQDKASAAESGWDFSTRWFQDHKTLYTIETTKIVPIDLNALICWNYDILEYLFERVGNTTESEIYREIRSKFKNTLNKVFYNKTLGAWFDYHMDTKQQNIDFYPSSVVPLFTGCYHALNQGKSERLFQYMQNVGAFNFSGGIPTSMIKDSEEQWDFPNGWSPLNHMIIEGLRKSENAQMQDQAYRIAKKWVEGNYRVFQKTKFMWEKYDVIGKVPRPGEGGEYHVQDGFGWTNGAILDLLSTYNDRIKLPQANSAAGCLSSGTNGLVMILCLMVSTMGAVILTQNNRDYY